MPDAPTYHCLLCFDEPHAWRLFWCVGVPAAASRHQPSDIPVYPCARRQPHATHSYAERCTCRDTNPVIAQYEERTRRLRLVKR